MRKSKRKFLSSLMCFVMGLSFGTNAGAKNKQIKSSSSKSLSLPEWITVISTVFLGNELILKPLVGKLSSKGGNVGKSGMIELNNKYVGVDDEVYKKYKLNQIEEEKKAYIEKVLNSIDTTVDEGSEHEWLKTIPNSLNEIRQVLHCLFLWYSTQNSHKIDNAKLTIGDYINWSYNYNMENALTLKDVCGVFEWYSKQSTLKFYYNGIVPLERFGIVIQKWAREMGFSKVEIVMYEKGGDYVNDYFKSSIKLKIHGFKYKLSDKENQILIDKLGLQGGDVLDLVNDDEEIEENMEDKNNENKIITLHMINDDDDNSD